MPHVYRATGPSTGADSNRCLLSTLSVCRTRTSLVNVWGTELLLALGGQLASEEELLRLMNNWAVVQAYYVGYYAVQALLSARGQPRPESHPKTQAQFAALWTDRALHLPPWTLGARDGGWCNLSSHPIDDSINPWSVAIRFRAGVWRGRRYAPRGKRLSAIVLPRLAIVSV